MMSLLFTPLLWAKDPRIAVVGAGMSGLSAAYQLQKDYGLDAQVYEASNRVGGRIYSKNYPELGVTVELGASFIDEDHHAIKALAAEFGLKLTSLKENGREERIYLFDGKVLDRQQIYQLFLPTLRRINADLEQIAIEKLATSNELTPREAELDQLTIRQYLDSLDAPELFYRLADATQFTEYGAHIDQLNALSLLDLIAIDLAHGNFEMDGQLGDEGHKIQGANSLVPENLAQRLRYPVKFDYQLTEVSQNHNGSFNLLFSHENKIEIIEVDYLLLALPTPLLKNAIKIDHQKLLNQNISKVINDFAYGNVTKFIMVFSEPVWRTHPGKMVDILSDKYDIWESSFNENNHGLYHLTIYTGGSEALNDRDKDPNRFVEEILQHLEGLYPKIRGAYLGHVPSLHWPSYAFSQGAFSGVFLPGQWGQRSLVREPGQGNIAFAGEQWCMEYAGFMEGALRSGQWAAHYIGKKARAKLISSSL